VKIGKNIVFIILAILLVGGSFVFAEYRNKQAKDVYVAPEVVSGIDRTSQDIDTDSDGTRDWEEILLGTDPKDPKSKPDASKTNTTAVKDVTVTQKELEPIDLVSREFFARYMELRQTGLSANEASQQELIERTVNGIKLNEAKPYLATEIKVRTDNSTESVKRYGNDIASVFKKYAIQSRNEGVIAKDALEKNDPKILEELDPVIASYRNIVNGILAVETPQITSTMHLDLLNGMNSALFVAQSFRKSSIDPIAGLQAASQYLSSGYKVLDAMTALKGYLTYLGVTYLATEPGVIFIPLK
jgi:serine/threonine protein kinase